MKLARIKTHAITAVFLFACAAGLVQPALGADHRDSPAPNGIQQGDLTDIFAFVSPSDPSKVVLVMPVNPFMNPNELQDYEFGNSDRLLYQFKIDNVGDAKTHLVVQILFTGHEHAQTYTVLFGAPNEQGVKNSALPSTDEICGGSVYQLLPSRTTSADETSTQNAIHVQGAVRCFAGFRDDPFGSVDVVQAVARIGINPHTTANIPDRNFTHDQDLFRSEVSPILGPLRGHAVRTNPAGAILNSGVGGFDGFDLHAIVIELPISMIKGTRTDGNVGVWATVSQKATTAAATAKYTQFERMGQELTNTVFGFQQPPTGATCPVCASVATDADLKDLINASDPVNDVRDFGPLGPDALTTTDNDGTGNTIAARATILTALAFTTPPFGVPLLAPQVGANLNTDKDLLRKILFPDILRLNLNTAPTAVLPGAAATSNIDPVLDVIKGGHKNVNGGFVPGYDYLPYGMQNGRRPNDAVLDILLRIFRELTDVKFAPTVAGLPLPIPGSGPQGTRKTLQCTQLLVHPLGDEPLCEDHRVDVVLSGTGFVRPDLTLPDITQTGNDRTFRSNFPWLAGPHPLPSDAGTIGFPDQTDDALQPPSPH